MWGSRCVAPGPQKHLISWGRPLTNFQNQLTTHFFSNLLRLFLHPHPQYHPTCSLLLTCQTSIFSVSYEAQKIHWTPALSSACSRMMACLGAELTQALCCTPGTEIKMKLSPLSGSSSQRSKISKQISVSSTGLHPMIVCSVCIISPERKWSSLLEVLEKSSHTRGYLGQVLKKMRTDIPDKGTYLYKDLWGWISVLVSENC